jgi:hypothetical protein
MGCNQVRRLLPHHTVDSETVNNESPNLPDPSQTRIKPQDSDTDGCLRCSHDNGTESAGHLTESAGGPSRLLGHGL